MIGEPTMSFGERRRAKPPPLHLPSGPGGLGVKLDETSLKTPMRTPTVNAPMMSYKVDPSVMTPDTAEFPRDPSWPAEKPWTEDEDGIIDAYLAKPPGGISQAYAPGELPPANTIGEIALQLLKLEGAKPTGWARTFEETRRRVFEVARRESMQKVGGVHRRTPSGISEADMPDMADNLERVIDVAEYDLVIPNFASSLSLTAGPKASYHGQGVTAPLSSPMEMNFDSSISSGPGPKRVPLSGGLLGSGPRPPSLLQRGKSFTSDDLLGDASPAAAPDHKGELQSFSMISGARGSSSSMSTITNSPPSSDDSHAVVREAGMEVEVEPYTPTDQAFPRDIQDQIAIHETSATPTGRKGRSASPESDTTRVEETPRHTGPSHEIPWTAPVPGRTEGSASSSNRRTNDAPLFADAEEDDRYLKRQRTRSNPKESRDRSNSAAKSGQ